MKTLKIVASFLQLTNFPKLHLTGSLLICVKFISPIKSSDLILKWIIEIPDIYKIDIEIEIDIDINTGIDRDIDTEI